MSGGVFGLVTARYSDACRFRIWVRTPGRRARLSHSPLQLASTLPRCIAGTAPWLVRRVQAVQGVRKQEPLRRRVRARLPQLSVSPAPYLLLYSVTPPIYRASGRTVNERFADPRPFRRVGRSEEHTSELQSLRHLVCRLL